MDMRKSAIGFLLRAFILLVGLCLLPAMGYAWQPSMPLLLTPEEIAWRQANPVVLVGVYTGDHMPYESWRGGQPDGLAVDYIRLVAARAGLQLEFKPYSDWEAVAFGAKSMDDFDLVLTQPVKPDRSSRFIMLRPYAYTSPVLIARQGDPLIRNDADLAQARIVMERRFRLQALEVRERFPQSTLLYANDGNEAMDMVANGEADAYIAATWVRARSLLNRRATNDLSMLGELKLPVYGIAPAVRQDRRVLAQILHKAESTISDREVKQLRARWGADEASRQSMPVRDQLSREDANVLRQLPTLRVGYEVDRYPYSFTNSEGNLDGLAADYLRALQRKVNLRVELVPASDWGALQKMVKAHEVDVIVAATTDDFTPDEMQFSQPYEYFPEVIVARMHGPPIAATRDLVGRRVAVRSETGVAARLRAVLSQSDIVTVQSNEAGLAMVARGKADAFVGTLPAIDSLIRSRHAAELHIVGPAGMDQELAFGVRSEFRDLLPIIDRVLASMEESDRQAIRSRWLTAQYQYGVSWTWVLAIATALLAIVGLISFAYFRLQRAVRARAAAELDLAAQLEFQQALLESIPYPIFVKDEQGRYVAVNRAYEQMLNCQRDQLLGKTLLQTRHVPQIDAATLHNDELAMIQAGASSRRALELQDSSTGHPRAIISWLHTFHGRANGMVVLLGTLVDVTDIREAESRARASEQRLSDITAALPATVFQFRLTAEGRREFTYAAGDVAGVLGVDSDVLLTDEPAVFERLHPEDRAVMMSMVRQSAQDMRPLSPFDIRIRNGESWRWLRTEGGQPRRSDDGSVEWSGYWIDTTAAHVQADALQEAKAQAESAASTKAAFLATMSHEIRTPMAGVLGLIELLARTPLDPEQSHMLVMADDSAKAMLQILDDILDYSRIESGRLNIARTAFDPRNLVDSVVGLFSAKAREKGLRLHAIQDWRVGGALMGDSPRIRQILTNLMSNAVKFTDHGSICMSMELVEDHGRLQNLRFIIEDSGIGIEPSDLQRLFQPFTQAEQSASRRFGGTGLGLAISRRLSSLMGGQLRLESEPGKGTRAVFDIVLEVAHSLQPILEFHGKRAWLRCRDGLRTSELSNALSALGFSVIESTDELDDEAFSDLSLKVVDAELAIDANHRANSVPIIEIDDNADGTFARHLRGHVVLPGNPILWHALADACHVAINGRPAANSVAMGIIERAPKREAHILVAEDHPTNRAVIAGQLEALGYDFTLVEDGIQALEALESVSADLLITDCHMPNMDGYALARRIRAREPKGQSLPIIALSASALPEQVQRCLDAGMNDFLAKPVQLVDLTEMLKKHLPDVQITPRTAPHRPGVAQETPAGLDPIVQLGASFGGRDAAMTLLQQLVETTHVDLQRLDQLPVTAEDDRRELLHRMEGALRLVQSQNRIEFSSESASADAREAEVRRQLHDLEAWLSKARASN